MPDLPNPTIDHEDINPYAPPQAETLASAESPDLWEAYETASKVKRFINFVFDRLAIYGVLLGLGFILAAAEGMGYIPGFSDWIDEINALEDILLTAVITVGYYWVTESLFGRTLGKVITGTKVISTAGLKPTLGAVLGRSLARIVPFEPFSLLLGNSAWHDDWSGTQVIDLRKKQSTKLSPALRKYYR